MSSIIEQVAALTVGTVEFVAPDEIKVVLELDAPQATALNTGEPSRFPRVNGFVLVPNETGALVGLVGWLGVERSTFPKKRTGVGDFGLVDLPFPTRKMSVNPVGTLRSRAVDNGDVVFKLERGVSVFPSVGDPVLLPTATQLRAIVEAEGEDRRLAIGISPLAANATVSVDPDKLFGRHLAVLGNTGSGKSCTVAGLIRWSLSAARKARSGDRPNARFIILDPNGEYLDTFSDLEGSARVFQAPPPREGFEALTVPAWIWNSHEWSAFAQAAPATQRPLLLQGLRNLRAGAQVGVSPSARLGRLLRGYRSLLDQLIASGASAYTGFGPAKSCGTMLRRLVSGAAQYVGQVNGAEDELGAVIAATEQLAGSHEYTFGGGTGYEHFGEDELTAVREAIDTVLAVLPQHPEDAASEDAPLPFDPRELAEHLEVLAASADIGQAAQFIATLTMRIRMMMADQRLGPIVAPVEQPAFEAWLESHIGREDAASGQIAILDLSLIPADVLHIVIAVIARVIFEATQRYRKLNGDELPTVLVLEEAHTFIQRREGAGGGTPGTQMCRETFERIAREGRKFGLGLVLSSQRPSELSETALAQCNTFLLHRIVNDRDQELVRRLVPDNLGGLLRELPNLPSRQAVLLGWATPVPVLVEINELPHDHQPRSSDPRFWRVWTGAESRPIDWSEIAADWSGTPTVATDDGE
jgi:DNA helicase HerA-like ATPase